METGTVPPGHTSLSDFPTELAEHICSFLFPESPPQNRQHFKWSRGQTDLSRLSRTCRRFRDIMQPLAHRSFPDRSVHSLARLARTLVARRGLRQHLKHITLTEPLGPLAEDDSRFIQACIARLVPPGPPDYWNVDGEGEYRLLPLQLVLAHAPNLEYLHLPLDYDWGLDAIDTLAAASRCPPLLPRLRTVVATHFFIAGDRFDASLSAVMALARAAPGLSALCMPSPNPYGSGSGTLPLQELRWLAFAADCVLSPALLRRMLAAAPKLESLSLHWDAFGDDFDHDGEWTVQDAWEAIAVRRDTLREVRLDINEERPLRNGGRGRGSLGDFERLEVLCVDGHALSQLRSEWLGKSGRHARVDSFLSGMFPPSIRELTFWRLDGREMKEAMLRFARVVALGRYPNLKSVLLAPSERSDRAVGDNWSYAEVWSEARNELEEGFGKKGVEFELRWESPYWSSASFD